MTDWIEHGERMRAEQERNPSPARIRLRELMAKQKVVATNESEVSI